MAQHPSFQHSGERRQSARTTAPLSGSLSATRSHATVPVAGSSSAIQASQALPFGSPPTAFEQPEDTAGESSGGSGKTQAVFVNKLYTMLENPNVNQAGLLRWSDDGMGFICANPAEFAR
jgi:hypothetical protein